jgi:hypothetical protein
MVVYIRVSQPLITAAFCFMGIKSRHGNTQCLVRLTGLEPATIRLEGGCSILLSYKRVKGYYQRIISGS